MYARIHKGGGGFWNPPEKLQNIGFLSNTGLDPLKITKLSSQHSMLGHHRHASETPFIPGPFIVVFGSSLPSSTKKTLSKLDHLLQNFLDPRMKWGGLGGGGVRMLPVQITLVVEVEGRAVFSNAIFIFLVQVRSPILELHRIGGNRKR